MELLFVFPSMMNRMLGQRTLSYGMKFRCNPLNTGPIQFDGSLMNFTQQKKKSVLENVLIAFGFLISLQYDAQSFAAPIGFSQEGCFMGSLFVNSNGKMLREQILLLFFTVLSSLLLCSCAFCDGEVKTTFPRGFSVSGVRTRRNYFIFNVRKFIVYRRLMYLSTK